MNLRNYLRSFKFGDGKQLQEVQLNQQQISHIIAGLFVFLFFIFMAGYYWGKKTALEHFTTQLENDSLADKVSYAFCSLYDAGEEAEEDDQPEETEDGDSVIKSSSPEQSLGSAPVSLATSVVSTGAEQKPTHEHFAQLAGFGAARTARSYAQILGKKGYEVKIVERKSTTARGRQTSWYQVVTPPYTDKDKLVELVDKIKKVTPIGDVKIVSVEIE